jgi:hypothetical protein
MTQTPAIDPPPKNEYVDWIVNGIDLLPTRQLPVPHYARSFIRDLWPATADYFSPLNSIFLLQCVKLEHLNPRKRWLIRDGIIPLHYFFEAHPKPEGLQCKIFIEESLGWIVPQSWLGNTGTYRVVSRGPSSQVKKCILCGLLAETYHSVSDLSAQLELLDATRLKKLERYIYLPLMRSPDENFVARYLRALHSKLGPDVTSLDWFAFGFATSYAGYEFIELANRKYCADSYFAHVLLGKGAYLNVDAEANGAQYVALSPHHGYLIHEEVEEKPEWSDLRQRHSLSVGADKSPYPWSDWFPVRAQTGQVEEG